MPPVRNPWTVVMQFGLIIIISAAIAGIVGGVTSHVNSWKSSSKSVKMVEVQGQGGGGGESWNGTVRVRRMVGVGFVS